jgi:hypothetical protein
MALNLICSILYDCSLLPYFLRYYSKAGVDLFIFALWNNPERVHRSTVEEYCHGFNVRIVDFSAPNFNGEVDARAHNRIREAFVNDNDWYVISDLDEFHYLQGYDCFNKVTRLAEECGASAVRGCILDRIAIDGSIPHFLDHKRSLGSQFPLSCNIIGAVIGAARSKILMARKHVAVTPGHHSCTGICWNHSGEVHHFKWFGGLVDETLRRMVSYEKEGLFYKQEPRTLLQYIKANGNRLPIDQPVLNATLVINDPFKDITGI